MNDSFVAVVDGSTSKTPLHVAPNMSNGRYAMKLITSLVTSMSSTLGCSDFCTLVTRRFREVYHETGQDMARLAFHPEERLTASAIVYSRHRHEIWMVGDCQCMVNGNHFDNPKPSEAVAAAERARVVEDALSKGVTEEEIERHDPGRDYILPLLIHGMAGQNKEYAVIDGFPIYMQGVRIIKLTQQPSEVILASDGYPILRPTLKESESKLSTLLRDDPLCIHSFKATKGLHRGYCSFDDRAFVRFLTD